LPCQIVVSASPPAISMSSLRATSGAEAADGPGGRKRGRPLGSQNKVRDPAAIPPVPQRCGRPPGSRNRKTLEALAAAAAAEPFGVSHSTAIVAPPEGALPWPPPMS
jgi:hypothetical protein